MSANDPIEEQRAVNLRRVATQFEAQRRARPHHTPGTGACDPEESCCDECAGAYAEADGDGEGEGEQ